MLERARWLRRSLRIYVPSLNGCRVIVKKGRFAKRQRDKGPRSPPANRLPLFSPDLLPPPSRYLWLISLSGEYHSFHLISDEDRLDLRTMLFRFRIDRELVIATPRRTKEATCERASLLSFIEIKLYNAVREIDCGILSFS